MIYTINFFPSKYDVRSSDSWSSLLEALFIFLKAPTTDLHPISPSLPPSLPSPFPSSSVPPTPSHPPVHNPLDNHAKLPEPQVLAPRFRGRLKAPIHRPFEVGAHEQVSPTQDLCSRIFSANLRCIALDIRSAPLCRHRSSRFLIISFSSSFMITNKSTPPSLLVQGLPSPGS